MTLRKLILLNIVLALICGALFVWYRMIPVPVLLQYQSVSGTRTVHFETRGKTVGAAVGELKSADRQNIIVDTDRDAPIQTDMTIRIRRGTRTKAEIAGKKRSIVLYPGTIKENLKLNKISYDKNDIVRPALSGQVTAATKLKVKVVDVKTRRKTVTVPAQNEVIFDRSLSSGTVASTSGRDGKGVYKYITTYVNGKKTKEKAKLLSWVSRPKNNSVRFGTSKTGETGSVRYTRTFTGNCTAYYAGTNARGATGQVCHYGTCAVDPSVIPYGTKLYIEGYGVAVANDCGGAVKGNVIDLYMNSTGECIQWGRRYKKVYVLE
ncbi:MAG: 3D domain-containing protein [Hornefia butyriciproducens]|uniref:3D domain-containing protein n=1 Tax=Hornefia butyriciproducens TaxID=2652293 RepID=UPI0029FD4AD3|nr:3D domain-containing protein [Hornefia butyriciproducens]MCI7327152.1 3D domain-containing protein [Clostridiales bacterium]MDD7020709.1 3D domain-containing protein [Hornefia butyriciproducens]MDY2990284.1 3D domain-containing protein [Hornefia butyriciproducens]